MVCGSQGALSPFASRSHRTGECGWPDRRRHVHVERFVIRQCGACETQLVNKWLVTNANEQKCAIYQHNHLVGERQNIIPGMIKRNSTYQPKHCRQRVNPSAADALHRLRVAIFKAAGFFLASVAGEIVVQAFQPEIKTLALMLRAFIGL